MKVFIDDLRDPVRFLGKERGEGMTWVKEWWEAKNLLVGASEDITEIHFDHYLGGKRTAGQLFEMVAYRITRRRKWLNLKDIYLHSSDTSIVENYIDNWSERLAEVGVTLHNNSRG